MGTPCRKVSPGPRNVSPEQRLWLRIGPALLRDSANSGALHLDIPYPIRDKLLNSLKKGLFQYETFAQLENRVPEARIGDFS